MKACAGASLAVLLASFIAAPWSPARGDGVPMASAPLPPPLSAPSNASYRAARARHASPPSQPRPALARVPFPQEKPRLASAGRTLPLPQEKPRLPAKPALARQEKSPPARRFPRRWSETPRRPVAPFSATAPALSRYAGALPPRWRGPPYFYGRGPYRPGGPFFVAPPYGYPPPFGPQFAR
jgi:hypothetical protein